MHGPGGDVVVKVKRGNIKQAGHHAQLAGQLFIALGDAGLAGGLFDHGQEGGAQPGAAVLFKESLIESEIPCGTGMCRQNQ